MNKATSHDSKRRTLREQLAAGTPTSFKITTMEVAQLDRQIDREIAMNHATRERRRAFGEMVRAGKF
jgi:hypothetical protein